MTIYFEKLRDPRWQKMRLEIMQRDNFECRVCGEKDKTLNVHHGYYARKTDPWDYPDNTLWTLCEGCHEEAQLELEIIHRSIAKIEPSGDAMSDLMVILDVGGEDVLTVHNIVTLIIHAMSLGLKASTLAEIHQRIMQPDKKRSYRGMCVILQKFIEQMYKARKEKHDAQSNSP